MFVRLHLEEDPQPARISFGVVEDIGARVALSIARDHLDVNRLEHWVRDRLIARIPGAGDAPE
jgi:hypothetical protein